MTSLLSRAGLLRRLNIVRTVRNSGNTYKSSAIRLVNTVSGSDSKERLVKAKITLEDGSVFEGISFGAEKPVNGEVVFSTGMVGYTESLTDPSFRGQVRIRRPKKTRSVADPEFFASSADPDADISNGGQLRCSVDNGCRPIWTPPSV